MTHEEFSNLKGGTITLPQYQSLGLTYATTKDGGARGASAISASAVKIGDRVNNGTYFIEVVGRDWDRCRISEAVETYSEFASNYEARETAIDFAIDALESLEDIGEYAQGDICDVAYMVTEGENVNGSWYCNSYRAKEETLNNLDFFQIVAEYAHETGMLETKKPCINIFDIEREHVFYRVVASEMLINGLYQAFCDNCDWADADNIGEKELSAFFAYYRGEE